MISFQFYDLLWSFSSRELVAALSIITTLNLIHFSQMFRLLENLGIKESKAFYALNLLCWLQLLLEYPASIQLAYFSNSRFMKCNQDCLYRCKVWYHQLKDCSTWEIVKLWNCILVHHSYQISLIHKSDHPLSPA